MPRLPSVVTERSLLPSRLRRRQQTNPTDKRATGVRLHADRPGYRILVALKLDRHARHAPIILGAPGTCIVDRPRTLMSKNSWSDTTHRRIRDARAQRSVASTGG